MPELAFSTALRRRLRRDDTSNLANRTEDWLIELIRERDDANAIEVAEYLLDETQQMVEYDVEVRSALWTWIADHLGEEALYASIREIAANASEASRVVAEAVQVANSATDTVNELGDSSTQISDVIKLITAIRKMTGTACKARRMMYLPIAFSLAIGGQPTHQRPVRSKVSRE